jgi:hypothetical protein
MFCFRINITHLDVDLDVDLDLDSEAATGALTGPIEVCMSGFY